MYSLKEIDFDTWSSIWNDCYKTNLLQSWEYGTAKENVENWTAVRFSIKNNDDQNVGLVQVLIKKLPIIGNIARINRGPILNRKMTGDDKDEVVINIVKELIVESKKRSWRLFQIAPELNEKNTSHKSLEAFGLKRLSSSAWASGLLSLDLNEDDLLMSLKGKWRNCLRKAMRSDISITNNEINSINIQEILDAYNIIKEDKNFSGISNSLLKSLSSQNSHNWRVCSFSARIKKSKTSGEPIGTLVSIIHGDIAIYLIGTTNAVGRKLNANYLLLWNAILDAKEKRCNWFDIGGLNKTTPDGIAHFKKGLNPDLYELIGEWRIFNFPWKRIK